MILVENRVKTVLATLHSEFIDLNNHSSMALFTIYVYERVMMAVIIECSIYMRYIGPSLQILKRAARHKNYPNVTILFFLQMLEEPYYLITEYYKAEI